MNSGSRLNGLDVACIAFYFVLVLATGFVSMFRSNRGTISGYFLAGRFMTWLPFAINFFSGLTNSIGTNAEQLSFVTNQLDGKLQVGASLFASNIGSEHFIGLSGSGAASGIGVGAFELNALIILQLLGWVFLPVYIASGVHTLPEYMSKRFGGTRIRIYLAVLSLMLYIFTKISVNMYSGALFVQVALGWNIYYAILLVLAMTAVCTVTGGLAAVIYTDTLQCFLMIVGATGLSVYSFIKVGGYSGLVEKYMSAIPDSTFNSTCGMPSVKAFTMLREPTDMDYPWPGFLLGQSPASIWYWAADQMMVQRALAAKSLSHAQGATIFAGYLKILPLFVIVMPGMISRVLYPNEVGCITNCYEVCENPVSCSNIAYPKLAVELLPTGARGIMLAVMMSALMSDLTSIFNSSSTLFTIDIWRRLRRKATAKEMLVVGRVWVLVMVGISLLWVPIVRLQQGGQLYIYIQAIAADLSPPIAAVYLLAILWKRTNEQGAFWGLACGLVVGVTRMILEFIYVAPACGELDLRPAIVSKLQYMYFALLLFWITVIVTVMISLLTEPPDSYRLSLLLRVLSFVRFFTGFTNVGGSQQLIRTTYWTRRDQTPRHDDHMVEIDHEKEVMEREGEMKEMDTVLQTQQETEGQVRMAEGASSQDNNSATKSLGKVDIKFEPHSGNHCGNIPLHILFCLCSVPMIPV